MSSRSLVENNDNLEIECFRLLKLLKLTVERLLAGYSPNVWNTYGSLSRLRAIIDDIFTNGLIYEGPQKYWEFLCGLFLQKPELKPTFDDNGKSDVLSGNKLCCQWLEKSLLEHTLSTQLQMLIQDKSRVLCHYKETAFLHNKACTDALLICLRAVENNQPALLADLDPSLAIRASDQSSIILNAISDGSYAMRQPYLVCDNAKEVFETSSSLDYVTPPESLADLDSETRSSSSHSNFCGGTDDVNGNFMCHVNERVSSQSFRNEQQQVWKNISLYSNQNCLSNVLINFTNDSAGNTSHVSNQNSISSHATNFTSCPVSNTDDSEIQTLGENSSTKIIQRQKSGSNSNIASPSSSSLCRSASTHSLPAGLNLNCQAMPQTQSRQACSVPNNGCLYANYQNSTNSFTEIDVLSCSRTISDFRDSQDLNVPLDAAIEATEGGSMHVPSGSWKAQHSRSKSDGTAPFQNGLIFDDVEADAAFSSSLPNILPLDENEKQKKKSIFEDNQVIVPTECFFPKPQPGQTLTSFLSSNDFNICAELDRENAHFCIAEALISAIEKIKCTQSIKYVAEEAESDEEIKTLTQRIRIRRREKLREKEMKCLNFLSDGKTDTTTSQSASPRSSSHSSDFDAGESIGSDDDEIEDIEISDRTESNLSSVKESGLSLSMASLYSDADIKKVSTLTLTNIDTEEQRSYSENCSNAQLSAEAIALSLLKQFSEKQLPKASDLQWLISEQEVPQQLLPLPDSWPVSPDSIDEDYNHEKTRLRGNLEWAPPRRQIIFMIQPDPKRKSAVLKQNYRCAGCGMKIEKSYIKKFRYCEYLGKFFCQCCHSNNLSYIPGRILWKWDFKNYYVSKFAFKLLDQMLSDPLFNIFDINSNLYRKVRQLDMCREYRTQLFYLKDFIQTCRKTQIIQKELDNCPPHILNDPHQYSINDFIQVKSGSLSKCLSTLVSKCISHVTQCMLCRAKGFICEVCDKEKDIIFPFQLSKVVHCSACGACFHKKCYKPGICPKCIRIKARKLKLLEQEAVQNSNQR